MSLRLYNIVICAIMCKVFDSQCGVQVRRHHYVTDLMIADNSMATEAEATYCKFIAGCFTNFGKCQLYQ